MQVAAYGKENRTTDNVHRNQATILHFSLHPVLPAEYTLALNTTLGTLSCLSNSNEHPQLVMQQQFTRSELSLLRPLLQSFPYYCPYEELFASFYNSNLSPLTIARARQQLQSALETGTWEQEMRPLRNVLSRTRLKLNTIAINITSILETGCILMAMPTARQSEARGQIQINAAM